MLDRPKLLENNSCLTHESMQTCPPSTRRPGGTDTGDVPARPRGIPRRPRPAHKPEAGEDDERHGTVPPRSGELVVHRSGRVPGGAAQ